MLLTEDLTVELTVEEGCGPFLAGKVEITVKLVVALGVSILNEVINRVDLIGFTLCPFGMKSYSRCK